MKRVYICIEILIMLAILCAPVAYGSSVTINNTLHLEEQTAKNDQIKQEDPPFRWEDPFLKVLPGQSIDDVRAMFEENPAYDTKDVKNYFANNIERNGDHFYTVHAIEEADGFPFFGHIIMDLQVNYLSTDKAVKRIGLNVDLGEVYGTELDTIIDDTREKMDEICEFIDSSNIMDSTTAYYYSVEIDEQEFMINLVTIVGDPDSPKDNSKTSEMLFDIWNP